MNAVREITTAGVDAGQPMLAGFFDAGLLADDAAMNIVKTGDYSSARAPGLHLRVQNAAGILQADQHAILAIVGTPLSDGIPVTAQTLLHAPLDDLKLGGRYALARIDRRTGAAQLRVDRFGVYPMCWSQDGRRLAFADRADAVPRVEAPEIDPQALYNYVYFHVIPAPRTVYRGVQRLEPANALLFDGRSVSHRATWQPRFEQAADFDEQVTAAEFLDCVRRAVAAEADAGAVGCFLSGGTDSSTVAGMLTRITGRAETFSIGFDQAGYDEMEYARIAARHFGTSHHEHYVTPGQLVDAIPAVAHHYDQPFGNSSAVPAFICASVARSRGIDKLLAGDGGDELFGGNSRYAKQKIFEAWWRLPNGVRLTLGRLFKNEVSRRAPLLRKATSYVEQASVPMPARLETYNLLHRFGAGAVFEPDFLRSIDPTEPARLQAGVYARQAAAPFVDRMLAYDWRFTLADNDLPKVVGTAALAKLRVGFPLLDDTLVDLSLRLPASQKVRGLRLRHFFKTSLRGFLPDEILRKKKHGFGLPVGPWLLAHPGFRGLAHESLSGLARRRVIRFSLVDDLFSRRLEAHPGYYGEMAWILMMLELWLQSRFDTWTLHKDSDA